MEEESKKCTEELKRLGKSAIMEMVLEEIHKLPLADRIAVIKEAQCVSRISYEKDR